VSIEQSVASGAFMIPVHDKKRYAWRFLLMSITVVLGGGAPRAQTGPLLPSVDLRRDVRLNSEVWPADFNGDGITDLVASRAATTSTPGAMHVVLGRGDGTFGTPIVTSVTGRVIEVGDFNGDRRVDVVVAADTNGVSILPGNGNGTFGAARQVDSEFGAFAITGDFNGDTRRDLILAGGPEIRVYPGNGDFTFGTPARLPFGELWPSSDCLASTVLDTPPCGGGVSGDFDNDGDRDFVVAGDSQAIHIFLNNGALLFQAREIVVGFQPTDVTTRDLDGNGALDLVVTVTSSENGGHSEGTVNVLKGNGDGTFQPAVRYRTGNGAFQVVVGDFTHDGQIDIATANRSAIFWPNCGPFIQSSDSVSILPGNNGVFGAPTTFALEDQSIPVDVDTSRFRNSVLSLNTSDLDRDRFPDLIVSQGALLLTRAPAANRPPIANAGPDVTIVNSSFVQLIGAATDPDNHLLDFVWRGPEGTDGLIIHPSSFCFEGLTLGAHTFTLSVDDGHGGHDDDAVVMTLEDRSVPPEVQVLRPAGGEVVAAGAPYTIRWTASDDRGIARIDLGAFIDVGPNGRSVPISECTGLAPTATECTWRNPPPTEGAIVFVSVRDTDGNIGGGASGQFFIRGTVPPNSLPEGWTNRDVGAVGAAGSSAFSAGRFTIRGSGADIWNKADEFQFAYRAIEENGEITAHVDSVQNLQRWVKAGVMIRESADAGARHVSLFATPTTEKGVAFQRRKTTGGASVHTAGPAITAPLWLRLTRVGDVFRSYYRKNTVDAWTLVGEETVPGFATPALFGLAVTSHVDGRLAEAVFSSVRADNLPTWTTSLVGTTQGSATFDQTRFSVDGAGADIWGTADGFTALWTGLVVPEETLTARVLSLENTNVWAKAGVMIRETMDPGGRHVMVVVTPGKGVAMQWRADRDGPSLSTTARPGAAPAWVRLIRRGNAYTGQTSSDGVTWVTLGTVNLSMSPSTNTLVVTSHNAAAVATAIFDDVRVERP
jgi:regulation of enolase protein 1 (concanavalin A-like superfamily)